MAFLDCPVPSNHGSVGLGELVLGLVVLGNLSSSSLGVWRE